jgi:hypothetical protein
MATKRSSQMTRKAGQRKWSMREHSRNIHVITIDFRCIGDTQSVLLQSDVHWDNPKCNQDLFMSHLAEARERDAPIVDIGDFHCAMQGKWDKRANKNDLRPEHQRADYLDALVTTAAEALKPYRDLLTVRGDGNHETGILKHHETSLTERLVERIRAYGDTPIAKGGYSGYIVFVAQVGQQRFPFKMHYHHGHGGGGPVTRGVIQSNRHAVYLADADIIHTGHTHDWWLVPIARVRLNQDNTKVVHSNQYHLSTPGYKDEYDQGYGGWHIERGGPPKPIGAAWLSSKYTGRQHVSFDITEAK